MKKVMLAANERPCLESIRYPVLASPKIDGVRACVQYNKCVAGRSLKDSLNSYVLSQLSRVELNGFDGELTVQGERWNDFNYNQSVIMTKSGKPKFTFWVFDNISRATEQAGKRKIDLVYTIAKLKDELKLPFELKACEQVMCYDASQVEDFYLVCRDAGFEGVILCDPDAEYKHGRSTLKQGIMLKLKPSEDSEAVIVSMEELMHNTDAGNSKRQENLVPGNTMGKLNVRWNGKLFSIGTGFDDATRKDMWENMDKYIGKLAKFKYMQLSAYGIPRSPVFLGIRHKDDL